MENVFVTGVHKGLGLAIARQLLEDGSRLFGLSRSEPEALSGRDGFSFLPLDLGRLDAIPEAVGAFLPAGEALDLAILNAGILGGIRDLRETPVETLREVMAVNVWANKQLIDALLAGGRRVRQVVAISSGAAFNGSGGWGPYSISKSALNLLVRVYAHEHPETHFAALAPGIVLTPMVREVLAAPTDPRHPANARIQEAHRNGEILPPEEAASRLLRAVPLLRERESGAFADVRKMEGV